MIHMEEDPREAKLPQWARDRMALYRMRIQEGRQAIDKLHDHEGPLEIRSFDDHPMRFNEDRVRFYMSDNASDYVEFLLVGGDTIAVRGIEQLKVLPLSSNMVKIKHERFKRC